MRYYSYDGSTPRFIRYQLIIRRLSIAVIIFMLAWLFSPVIYDYSDSISSGLQSSNSAVRSLSSEGSSIVATSQYPQLSVPSLDILALVESVGLTPENNMAVPNSTENIGIYKNGVLPGQIGNTVLTGHVDGAFGKRGVFYDLKKIAIGDDIFYKNSKDETVHYRVTEKRNYSALEENTDEIFNNFLDSGMTLITCDGVWNPLTREYGERLVVFAELAS